MTKAGFLKLSLFIVGLCLCPSVHAQLGEKLEVGRKHLPNLVEKESKLYGRTFLVRYDEEARIGGVNSMYYFLDGELVMIDTVLNTDSDSMPDRMFHEKFAKKIWEFVFGEEKIETKKDFKNKTRWNGQNGSVLDFGTGEVQGRKFEFITVSSAKMSVIRDRYYQAELAKIPAPEKKEDDGGLRLTGVTFFGGERRVSKFQPLPLYEVDRSGAVYDGYSGKYLGETIRGNRNE